MPKIIRPGNRPWGTEFPEFAIPDGAKRLDRPEDIFKVSLPCGILPLFFCYALIGLKRHVLGSRAADPVLMPAGILLGLLLTPVRELLHALCCPRGAAVYVGVSLRKFAAFSVCNEAVTRTRFPVMSLAPVILGLIPFAVFLLALASAVLSGFCIPAGMIGMLSPMPDYMDVCLVCRQVPKGTMIQTSAEGFLRYRKT